MTTLTGTFFPRRSLLPEKMDREDIPAGDIHHALKELETVNRFLGGYNVILDALNKLEIKKEPLRIIDLGSGGGDMLRAVSAWAEKKNIKIVMIGLDKNPVMTEFAAKISLYNSNISYQTMDVLDPELKNMKADICMSSLFCHHFDNDQLVRLLKHMKEVAGSAIIINDLQRHWFAYYAIKVLTAIFSGTYLVKYDAPLSVARSLTKKEWAALLEEAGITKYKIRWMWAWRWQLIIDTTA